MIDNVLSLQISYPDDITDAEAVEAVREMIQLGRSKLAKAKSKLTTKDELAIKYLRVKVLKIEQRP